jgi:hypothetical protein
MYQTIKSNVTRQIGLQNLKHRGIRVATVVFSVLVVMEGPPKGWNQWVGLGAAAFGALWTSEERQQAELAERKPIE